MRRGFSVVIYSGLLFVFINSMVLAAVNDLQVRIEYQQTRIDQGIASGVLTRSEADIVQDNLNLIKADYARMKADRLLNQWEIERLTSMLDRNSNMIFNKKHNPIVRFRDFSFQDRLDGQQKRIDQGIASGALTRSEADIVQDNLNWIKADYARMTKDLRLTIWEMERLDSMLDRNSNMIFNKKHNPIVRFRNSSFNNRIDDQQRRIDQGIASGVLTHSEADIVQGNLNWIKATYAEMMANGRLTPGEVERLDRLLDQNSSMIFIKKHNPIIRLYR
jgi:predicted metal-dependent hydrolase